MHTSHRPVSRVRRLLLPIAAFGAVTLAALLLRPVVAQDADPTAPGREAPVAERPRVLVFSKTAGFRHDSIPDGIRAIRDVLADVADVDATEDSARFTKENLARYRTVVFLSTTGDVLDADQQRAFEGFIRAGGGYAGVHAAADTEYGWPWYGRLVGAWFKSHPRIQEAEIVVEDRTHASTLMLPARWTRTDEWYAYRENPRPNVRVLASLDESTYEGGGMGGDHPIAWCHELEGGRAWYTGGGHTKQSFREDLFLQHLRGGILWSAGLVADPAAKEPAGEDTAPRRDVGR